MPRVVPSAAQDFVSSVIIPLLSVSLLSISVLSVISCILLDKARSLFGLNEINEPSSRVGGGKGCVIISGGRMSKGLTLARAFKRAGWKVIGVEEEGWGELCPMRFSSAISSFYLLPPAAQSYSKYSDALIRIAQAHSATLFIPVSGAGSSVEDARAADRMFATTNGKCKTFIQDPETMLDLHDKDRFMALVERMGMITPGGKMVESTDQAMDFLQEGREPKYILKCMGLDENRGDMTLYPLAGDDVKLSKTRRALDGLNMTITKECPYVFQEFIPGQEWCTHASVIDGRITSFVTCPSNDMLMTYEDATRSPIGVQAQQWTQKLLDGLKGDPTPTGQTRRLTGHFSFDLILSTRNGEMYPIECNARVHTACILLPLSRIAECYDEDVRLQPLKPVPGLLPRSWLYNDLVMRYLPLLVPSHDLLGLIHPSLPGAMVTKRLKPSEAPLRPRVDPTLIADDWLPFLVLWHVYWPWLLVTRWWQGKKWTRLNVSTGRIFEA